MATLDPSIIEGPLQPVAPGVIDLAVEDSSVYRVSQLAERGDALEAARQAQALLADRVYDMRLIGYFLFGLFLERGITYLPELLARVRDLLRDDFGALGPSRKKPRVVDAVLLWLFQSMDARIRFHAEFRDETWQAWLAASDPEMGTTLAEAIAEVQSAADARLSDPQCLVPLGRLQRWSTSDLARALARHYRPLQVDAAKSEPVVQAASATSDAPVVRPMSGAAAPSSPDRPPEDHWAASPAMRTLLKKLRGFEALVDRGDHAKAAIVANDIRQIIEGFDPVLYLPRLFAGYFKLLHRVVEEITPYWHMTDTPSWHALEQFYRADLDAFLDE